MPPIFFLSIKLVLLSTSFGRMDCKRKANKGGFQLVNKPSEEVRSSVGDNKRIKVGFSPRSLQEVDKCSGTSKDVF